MVASDRAAIEAAQVALSYSRITAPTAGRAGAINVFPGSFVQPSGTALVTITQLDPIAVAFSLPQRNLGQALAAMRGGGGKVTATFPESGASASGKLLFVDNTVDANSGTVKVKAEFANKDERLWPGAFVNIRLAVQMLRARASFRRRRSSSRRAARWSTSSMRPARRRPGRWRCSMPRASTPR